VGFAIMTQALAETFSEWGRMPEWPLLSPLTILMR